MAFGTCRVEIDTIDGGTHGSAVVDDGAVAVAVDIDAGVSRAAARGGNGAGIGDNAAGGTFAIMDAVSIGGAICGNRAVIGDEVVDAHFKFHGGGLDADEAAVSRSDHPADTVDHFKMRAVIERNGNKIRLHKAAIINRNRTTHRHIIQGVDINRRILDLA